GEAVVHGDQVDRGGGSSTAAAVEVGGSGEPGGEFADQALVAAPEVAHGVAVAAVPFAPQGWESADVVAVGRADVPGLGDEFGSRHDGVLGYQVEEGGQAVEAALLAGQGRGQVEAEPV